MNFMWYLKSPLHNFFASRIGKEGAFRGASKVGAGTGGEKKIMFVLVVYTPRFWEKMGSDDTEDCLKKK